MAGVLSKNGNTPNIPARTYEFDTIADRDAYDISGAPISSKCHIIHNDTWYMLDSAGLWWPYVPCGCGSGGGDVPSPEDLTIVYDGGVET